MTDQRDGRHLAAGLIFAAVGACAVILVRRYSLGNPVRIGPGGFPLLLGTLLVALGIAHVVTAFRRTAQPRQAPLSWRAVIFVSASVLVFGATVDRLGLVPAIIISTWIACLAQGPVRWLENTILSVAMAAVGAGLFVYGLGLPFTLFQFD